MNDNDIDKAMDVAMEYAQMVVNKWDDMEKITVMRARDASGSKIYFDCTISFEDGSRKKGTITVKKNGSSYEAENLLYD